MQNVVPYTHVNNNVHSVTLQHENAMLLTSEFVMVLVLTVKRSSRLMANILLRNTAHQAGLFFVAPYIDYVINREEAPLLLLLLLLLL
jgi:hypothetical protein